MKILITAASTAQAYQLQRFLDNTDTVIFADSVDLPTVMLKDKQFIKIPPADSVSFAHLLLTICLDLQIDKVYPLRNLEALALAEARQLFDEYNIKVIVPAKAEIQSYLNGATKNGELIIIENIEDASKPDRGVFLRHKSEPILQLFTVD